MTMTAGWRYVVFMWRREGGLLGNGPLRTPSFVARRRKMALGFGLDVLFGTTSANFRTATSSTSASVRPPSQVVEQKSTVQALLL